VFLPIVVLLHTLFINQRRGKVGAANALLVVASLLFYTWGSGSLVALLAVSVAIDFVAARLAHHGLATGRAGLRQAGVAISVIANVSLLGWYKYAGFLGRMTNDIADILGFSDVGVPMVLLPIGISFFTFQSMSYTFDVSAGKLEPFGSPLRLLLYVSLFPQLIAGPIVRAVDVADRVERRSVGPTDLSDGFSRFIWGLGKKVLVADSVAPLVDTAFAAEPSTVTALIAGLGYAVQIYFDFSGYSDMAIGIGRMLGFEFPENFSQPYRAASVTDFWRRWHITLSSWFRDYLYIPLGGNRCGKTRTPINLAIVFLITGLWHFCAVGRMARFRSDRRTSDRSWNRSGAPHLDRLGPSPVGLCRSRYRMGTVPVS
jgi:alginate O-acetyltransferase complex protein AlgI